MRQVPFLLLLLAMFTMAPAQQFTPAAGYAADEIIIKFNPAGTTADRDKLLTHYGITIRPLTADALLVLGRITSSYASATLSSLLVRHPLVSYSEPNYRYRLTAIPNDPYFKNQWGLHNIQHHHARFDADIDAPEAWQRHQGSKKVIIGIIDSGVDYLHEDLRQNIWINPREIPGNGKDDDGNGFIDDVRGWNFYDSNNDPMDVYSHGTHVSGILGAMTNNSIGVAGLDWAVGIMPVKCFSPYGYGFLSDIIPAIKYAVDNGARIINASWGSPFASDALREIIAYAQAQGVVFVAAAGNYGTNNDRFPFYPASYDLPNVIAVAASTIQDSLAFFSNYGPQSVDLAAPGLSIVSTIPHNRYAFYSGTSMAAPFVCGAAALALSQQPQLAADDLCTVVMASTDPLPSLTGRVKTGGRLNAAKCLQNAENFKTRIPPSVMQYLYELARREKPAPH